MAITRVEDHFEDSKGLFIQVFRDKPRLNAILASYAAQADALEAVFWQLLTERNVDNAVGVQLDILGKLVGQPRVGTTDETYRLFIRTRIRANRSKGRASDAIAVARLALDGAPFEYQDWYPASVIIEVPALDLPDGVTPELVQQVLRDAAPAGVRLDLHYSAGGAVITSGGDPIVDDYGNELTDVPLHFTCASGDDEEDDVYRGFADDDEDGDEGGFLIEVANQ